MPLEPLTALGRQSLGTRELGQAWCLLTVAERTYVVVRARPPAAERCMERPQRHFLLHRGPLIGKRCTRCHNDSCLSEASSALIAPVRLPTQRIDHARRTAASTPRSRACAPHRSRLAWADRNADCSGLAGPRWGVAERTRSRCSRSGLYCCCRALRTGAGNARIPTCRSHHRLA